MDGFILAFAGIVALIIFLLTAGPRQRSIEAARMFRGRVCEHRAAFFQEVFDLNSSNLEFFHFDGKDFHLPNERRHFSEFSRVRRINSQVITVRNPELPHNTKWLYERIDGGPDRRYHNNFATMKSVMHSFVIEGSHTFELYTYTRLDGIGHEFERFNKFLEFSGRFDTETILSAYVMSRRDWIRLEQEWSRAVARKKELDAALEAARRLGVLPIVTDKLDRIRAERKIVESSVSELGRRTLQAQEDLSNGIRRVKKMKARLEDLETVRSVSAP